MIVNKICYKINSNNLLYNRTEFPNIEIRGYFLHFLQNMKKQVAAVGLMV
jgi:hypothetical protein